MIRIKNVEYLNEYRLKLSFSDGKMKVVNFENWINEGGTYILPLRDMKYFKKVKMDEFNYTICWPNGADFCPDVLYEMGENINTETKPLPRRPHRKILGTSRSRKSAASINTKSK